METRTRQPDSFLFPRSCKSYEIAIKNKQPWIRIWSRMFTCWRHKTANPHITAEAYGPHFLIFSRVFAVQTSQLCLKNMPMSRERVILTPELELGSKVQNDPPWVAIFIPGLTPNLKITPIL